MGNALIAAACTELEGKVANREEFLFTAEIHLKIAQNEFEKADNVKKEQMILGMKALTDLMSQLVEALPEEKKTK